MQKGIKRVVLDLPTSLYNVVRDAAGKRYKTIDEHIRDILRNTYKIN